MAELDARNGKRQKRVRTKGETKQGVWAKTIVCRAGNDTKVPETPCSKTYTARLRTYLPFLPRRLQVINPARPLHLNRKGGEG